MMVFEEDMKGLVKGKFPIYFSVVHEGGRIGYSLEDVYLDRQGLNVRYEVNSVVLCTKER